MTVNEPVPDTFEDTPARDRDPDWFKRAVFYEVLVRSFQDSDGDGVGDLKGLTSKLDYLQWLGVDCLWLPPFFKSPLRDGGYDVSDYLGIDGFRLDAVPYLYAAEDTNCENLPATHAFLKRVRREIDALYPDTVLLAEANQWPEDVVDYFGDYPSGGDECHMAQPRRAHARNGHRRRARLHVGRVRQGPPHARLAPLLDNDRHTIELFTALLLSLPGSPILYYGDEIGMGDNIWLGDRDAVRTRLCLPAIMDPVYGHQVTNVEASMSSPSSLLHWTRRMIEIRKQNPAFGLGSYTELPSSNPAVLAFLREYEDDLVLCVNNFARFAQPTELDLREFAGRHPVELFGGVRFPAIGELPYLLTLGGHGFYWFRLTRVASRIGRRL